MVRETSAHYTCTLIIMLKNKVVVLHIAKEYVKIMFRIIERLYKILVISH
jgi:hypothetical protein